MANCIGTYPKWLAYCLKWFMSKQKGYNVKLRFRGRGKRYERGNPKRGHHNDLRLEDSKRVAIYIT